MLTIEKIKEAVKPLALKYNLEQVDLFGSYANGAATELSDVDFLVKFSSPIPSICKVMGLEAELSKNLDCHVDVVTLPITNPQYITLERTVNVYER